MIDLAEAINTVIIALKRDPEYRATWVANLTMATHDELPNDMDHEQKRKISNDAAERFLGWLCVGDKP